MDIFVDFVIVHERSIALQKITQFDEANQFAALSISFKNNKDSFEVKDIGNSYKSDVPLAQITLWQWTVRRGGDKELTDQVIEATKILTTGESINFVVPARIFDHGIIVRILKRRERNEANPCPPLSSHDDDLEMQIGGEKITVSAHWLMSISPVIHRMFSVDMKEKQQRSLTLDELGVNMEQFMEFLGAISPVSLYKPIHVNPSNVLMLLKLADFFQIDWLKSRCETHLINCVEIQLIDRFLLIDRYRLDSLKISFCICLPSGFVSFFVRMLDNCLHLAQASAKNCCLSSFFALASAFVRYGIFEK